MITSLEYYINRGFSKEEAVEQLKNRQHTFSLEKCIEKYGPEIGLAKFEARQEKWQNTLSNKSPEEKADILNRKLKNIRRYSLSSVKLFMAIKNKLEEENISLTFYCGEKEKFIYDKEFKRIFFYDLYIKEIRLIVEYNGKLFHPRENLSEKQLLEWKCPISKRNGLEVSQIDKRKKQLALSEEYSFLTIWEDDSNNEQILYQTIKNKVLNENYNKHGFKEN